MSAAVIRSQDVRVQHSVRAVASLLTTALLLLAGCATPQQDSEAGTDGKAQMDVLFTDVNVDAKGAQEDAPSRAHDTLDTGDKPPQDSDGSISDGADGVGTTDSTKVDATKVDDGAVEDAPSVDIEDQDAVAQDSGEVPDGGAADSAGDSSNGFDRVRPCTTNFVFSPTTTNPVKSVQIAGSWDWAKIETLQPTGKGDFGAKLTLPSGLHCYKLIVDGTWQLDPAQPYRAWCNGVENSGARVPDCKQPLLKLATKVQRTSNTLSAKALFFRGSSAPGPKLVTATLWHDFVATPLSDATKTATYDASTWQLHVTLDFKQLKLKPGKYTVELQGTDLNGTATEPIWLPFWVESTPFTWQGTLLYMTLLDRFVDGDKTNNQAKLTKADAGAQWHGGDLKGLLQAIESGWMEQLGVGALWLSPVTWGATGPEMSGDSVHQVSGYHGYWPTKPRSIDTRFGTAADLKAVVKAAHERGIRVLMDFVLNHVHEDHPYHLKNGTKSADPWFNSGCMCGTSGCDWTLKALTCLFRPYMPDLDWKHPDASEQMIADGLWWLRTYDLDGMRVDAVKHVDASAVFNLAAQVRERFEAAGTDYFLTGETAMGWSGDSLAANKTQYGTINAYLGPTGLDGQFDFVLYHAVVNQVFARSDKSMVHLDVWTQHSQTQYSPNAVMTPFFGSHDTARLTSRADYRGQAGHPTSVLNHQWSDQTLPAKPGETEPYARARLALCWLLTIPGAPMLYMGDAYGEYGARDPDNRHPFRGLSKLPADALNAQESGLLATSRKLGQARMKLPALRTGAYQSLGATKDTLPFRRTLPNGEAVVVVLHRSAKPAAVSLDLGKLGWKNGTAKEHIGLGAQLKVSGGKGSVTMPAWSCGVFSSGK